MDNTGYTRRYINFIVCQLRASLENSCLLYTQICLTFEHIFYTLMLIRKLLVTQT